MKIHWVLLIFSACVALGSQPRGSPATFCGDPARSDYTLIQEPFFGDQDFGQPGIILETVYGDASLRWFMIYQNGIDFKPIVRGSIVNFDSRAHNLGTWTEINWENYPRAYGGVSVIEGNDGAVLFQSEDTGAPTMGFPNNLVPIAPEECRTIKHSQSPALKPTDKDGYDQLTREFTMGILDDERVSIHKNYTATVMSHSGRFKVTFLYGYH
ncbi:hypothetical protein CEP54_015901 [Fusarium duplospermum]|uniref:Uncharacterized protein n=1 Tax=Fusarium duplospermum TaxID=1325734 RepID=A0A428NK42_9HYPO|nr:hypothetical protein CEP54_015901 [Fusarium duplospermum]